MYKGGSNSASLTKGHGVNVSQATEGLTPPWIVGTTQSKLLLVWYNNFKTSGSPTNPGLWMVVGSGAASGKKGGKASKKGGEDYTSANIDCVAGLAPIRTVFAMWYNNQLLAVRRASASGVIVNGQFTFTPSGGNSDTTITGTVPSSSPYQVTATDFISDMNNVKVDGVNLQGAQDTPGAGQYSVDDSGVYTFNVAQAGQPFSIEYRMTVAGEAGTLAGIIGCTVAERYSETFDDFGGPGPVTYTGTWENPLWNSRWAVPGRVDPGAYNARAPYLWWWDGVHPTLYFPAALEGKPVTVHYGVPVIFKSDGTPANTRDTPLQLLNFELEHRFAEGAEYANYADQQIIQDWVAGLGSVSFDFGLGDAMPNLNLETLGMYVLWPSGDCDVVDALVDIVMSGPMLVAQGGSAQVGADGPLPPPSLGGGSGTVSGVVLDASTSSPISGATVSYTGGSATTASDGTFSFSGVASGTYTFTISASGYMTLTQSATVFGASTTTEFDLTLAGTGGGSGSGAGWTAINNIQSLSGWLQPGNSGNSGGSGVKPHGTWTMTANGDGTETFAIVPAAANDNFYFYIPILPKPRTAPRKLKYHVEFDYPSGNLAKSQAFEFELQFSDGRLTYNMAWQADVSKAIPTWRYFHYIGKPGGSWIDTGIPVNVIEGAPMIVDAVFALDAIAGTTTHESLTVDSVVHAIGAVQAAIVKRETNYLHAAVQLDSLSSYQPYQVKVKANVLWLP